MASIVPAVVLAMAASASAFTRFSKLPVCTSWQPVHGASRQRCPSALWWSLEEMKAMGLLDDKEEQQAEVVQVTPAGLIGHFEAEELLKLKAYRVADSIYECHASIDMGKTTREVCVLEEGIGLASADGHLPPTIIIEWDELQSIVKKASKGQYNCWELYADGKTLPWKVSGLSKTTNRPAMLCAPLKSPGPPTMVLGGFTMHRISGGDQAQVMDPGLDTEQKIIAAGLKRAHGRVLDTCTGLGYTAIGAARCSGVTEVVTVELDEVSLEMCSHNPWSQELFTNPKIKQLTGDCCQLVKDMAEGEFSVVLHDPPARALCKDTDVYGLELYSDLFRVLKRGGTLFHYVGNPESKEAGRLFRGVMDRLDAAGFADCKTNKKAFGIVAVKR